MLFNHITSGQIQSGEMVPLTGQLQYCSLRSREKLFSRLYPGRKPSPHKNALKSGLRLEQNYCSPSREVSINFPASRGRLVFSEKLLQGDLLLNQTLVTIKKLNQGDLLLKHALVPKMKLFQGDLLLSRH